MLNNSLANEVGLVCHLRCCLLKVCNEDPSVCEKGLRTMIDERKQALKITREVAVSEVADLSILREAQRKLRIR